MTEKQGRQCRQELAALLRVVRRETKALDRIVMLYALPGLYGDTRFRLVWRQARETATALRRAVRAAERHALKTPKKAAQKPGARLQRGTGARG